MKKPTKKPTKKLALTRETLAHLEEGLLGGVRGAGAAGPTAIDCSVTC
ncbi:MAG: class I lanthipeptide [Thermoanaerobaculia bacterium]